MPTPIEVTTTSAPVTASRRSTQAVTVAGTPVAVGDGASHAGGDVQPSGIRVDERHLVRPDAVEAAEVGELVHELGAAGTDDGDLHGTSSSASSTAPVTGRTSSGTSTAPRTVVTDPDHEPVGEDAARMHGPRRK